jgi:hypothetical protein
VQRVNEDEDALAMRWQTAAYSVSIILGFALEASFEIFQWCAIILAM